MADDTDPKTEIRLVAEVSKQDGLGALVQSNALEIDDQFIKHLDPKLADMIIVPPYNPDGLRRVIKENNAVRQCIDAMEVNIDGTGYTFTSEGDEEETDEEKRVIEEIQGFFKEPWPGESFTTQRRKLRREKEEIGYGFVEVIRNPQDEILFTRVLPSHTVRLVRLDEAVPVEKTVYRNGKEVSMRIMCRERRFVQRIGDKAVFFREFGSSRDVNKETGEWKETGRLKAELRGSELMYFIVYKDSDTPYGVPRWINQTPSILGSRKAEEQNLNFFDNEGIPPVIIFLHGILTGTGSKEVLEKLLNVKHKDRTRAAVFEVSSSEGSLDKGGSSKVQVERLSSDQQSDAMFENYDDKCEKRARSSFRLPPLFVGRIEGFNYACYDAETETLSDIGWIKYWEYVPGMKIATVVPETGKLEYHEPLLDKPLVYDVENLDMYRIEHQHCSMLVTPSHRMCYRKGKRGYVVQPIEEMVKSDRVSVRTSIVSTDHGRDRLCNILANPEVFLKWLGYQIADGITIRDTTLKIGAVEERKVCAFKEAIFAMEKEGYRIKVMSPIKVGQQWFAINSRRLTAWVKNSCGVLATNKKIPREVLDLNVNLLRVLFDALMLCNGIPDMRKGRQSFSYSTVSKELADNIQELAIKLGYRTKVRKDRTGSYGVHPIYRVSMTEDKKEATITRYSNVSRESYAGKVYCFSVPNGVFVTRRNGIPAIQGNTAFASYAVAEAQVFKPERDEFDEKITITLLRAMGYVGYEMKSKPLSISDALIQLKGIEMGKDEITPENKIAAINSVTNLALQFDEEGHERKQALQDEDRKRRQEREDAAADLRAALGTPAQAPSKSPSGREPTEGDGQVAKKMDTTDLIELAADYSTLLSLRDGKMSKELKEATKKAVSLLDDDERAMLDYVLATNVYPNTDIDPEGLADIAHAACGCFHEE